MSNKHITATGIHDYLKEHILLLILLFLLKPGILLYMQLQCIW